MASFRRTILSGRQPPVRKELVAQPPSDAFRQAGNFGEALKRSRVRIHPLDRLTIGL